MSLAFVLAMLLPPSEERVLQLIHDIAQSGRVLEIGENPGPCNGAPVHRVRIFDGRLGAVVTRYVCPGHCGVMDEVYQRMNGGPDRSATQDN